MIHEFKELLGRCSCCYRVISQPVLVKSQVLAKGWAGGLVSPLCIQGMPTDYFEKSCLFLNLMSKEREFFYFRDERPFIFQIISNG